MFFFISLYVQQVLGYDALEAGLGYLPLAVVITVSAGVASQMVTRIGFKTTLIVGLLFVAAGLVWFSQVTVGGNYVANVLFPSLLAAIGLGFSFVAVTIGAMAGTSHDDAGLASGLINTSQQIGGALGLAILAALANSRTSRVLAGGGQDRVSGLTEGFQLAFLVAAGFAVLGGILAATLISSRDSREAVEAARRGEPVAVAA
jgi:Na+/melibiose symporter-like transporter